jgi:hypothetical protein
VTFDDRIERACRNSAVAAASTFADSRSRDLVHALNARRERMIELRLLEDPNSCQSRFRAAFFATAACSSRCAEDGRLPYGQALSHNGPDGAAFAFVSSNAADPSFAPLSASPWFGERLVSQLICLFTTPVASACIWFVRRRHCRAAPVSRPPHVP